MFVSILIVCYNSKGYIIKCIESIPKDGVNKDFEILLLDNSNDGVVDLIRSTFSYVKIIENSENLGFAAGNNKLAKQAKGKYLFLLNPDTSLMEGCLENTLKALSCTKRPLLGHMTYYEDGGIEGSSLQIFPGVINNFNFTGKLKKIILEKKISDGKVKNKDVVSGAALIIETKIWRELNGFDTRFFMCSEEVDLCYRVWKNTGLNAEIIAGPGVYHYVGKSYSSSYKRNMAVLKGQIEFGAKHFSSVHNFLFRSTLFINLIIKLIFSYIYNRKNVKELKRIISSKSEWMRGYGK